MNQSIRILLIEDNPDDALLIRSMLQTPVLVGPNAAPFHVEHAANLTDGLARLDDHAFDLVLLDLGLPESVGIETLLRLKGSSPDTSVIILTGHDDEQFALQAVDAGAEDYLTKSKLTAETIQRTVQYAAKRISAHEVLQENETRFRSVIETALDSIVVIDGEGMVLEWNPRAVEMFGYSQGEIVGHRFSSIIPQRFQETHQQSLQSLLSSSDPGHIGTTIETFGRRKDGTEFPIEISVSTWHAHGQTNFTAFIRDLTEIKKAEALIRESQRQMETLLANLPGMAFRSLNTRDRRMTFISQGCQEITGYEAEELLKGQSTSYAQIIRPDDREDVWQDIQASLAQSPSFELIYQVKRKDGQVRWVWEKGQKVAEDQDGTAILEGFVTDITPLKLSQEMLEYERDRNQNYLDIAGVMFVALDDQGRVSLINKYAADLLGYPQDEILGSPWVDNYIPAPTRQEVRSVYTELMSGSENRVKRFENEILCKDGTTRLLAWHNIVLKDDQGTPIGTLSSGADITERVKAEKAIRENEKKYRELFENVPVGLYRTKPDGQILEVNQQLQTLLGYDDRDELIGQKTIDGYSDSEDYIRWRELLESEGRVDGFVSQWKKKDGQLIWVEESTRTMVDSSGNLLYFEGSVADITDRVQARWELETSEEKYRLLFENIMDGFALHEIVVDESGKSLDYIFLEVNTAFEIQTGLSREEVIGKPVTEVLPGIELDPSNWIERYGEVVRTGREVRFDAFAENLGKWFSVLAFKPREGQFATIFSDISARKLAEETEKHHLERLAALHEIDKAISASLNLEKLLDLILAEITNIIDCDTSSVQLLKDNRLEIAATRGFAETETVHGLAYPVTDDFPNFEVIHSLQPIAYEDVQTAYPLFSDKDQYGSGGIRSWLGVPLVVADRVIGMLTFDRHKIDPFDESDIETLSMFAAQAGIAIQNAQLYEEIKAKEAGYRQIFEGIQDAIFVEDANGQILDVNQRAVDLLGYSREEFLSMNAQDLLPEGKVAILASTFEELNDLNSPFETVNVAKDGKHIPVEISVSLEEIGEQTLELVVVRDVTERRMAELEIKQQIDRLEALREIDKAIAGLSELDSILDVFIRNLLTQLKVDSASILLLNSDNQRLEFAHSVGFLTQALSFTSLGIGDGLAGMVAKTLEPIIITDLKAEEQAFKASKEFAKEGFRFYYAVPLVIRGELSGILEIFHRDPFKPSDDWIQFTEMLSVEAAIAIDNAALLTQLQHHSDELEVAVDQATDELKRTNERLAAILNNSSDGILLLSPEGRIIEANQAVLPMFGVEAEALLGQSILDLFEAEAKEIARTHLNTLPEKLTNTHFEAVASRSDSTTYDAEFHLNPIIDQDELRSVVCTVRDITAWTELQRMKDAFVSNVSHELRTPITSLRLNYSLLRRDPSNPEKYLNRFEREIDRLNDLIEDLLRLSRLDSGRTELQLTELDMNELISTTVQDRSPIAISRGLDLSVKALPDACRVIGDENLLGQALSVLLTNALNYTPEGGHIEIGIINKISEGKPWCGFYVQDDGPGINEEDIPNLFDRFYRGKVGRESSVSGTGLGLAIANEILKRHQGTINVQTGVVDGHGCRFTAWIPIRPGIPEQEK